MTSSSCSLSLSTQANFSIAFNNPLLSDRLMAFKRQEEEKSSLELINLSLVWCSSEQHVESLENRDQCDKFFGARRFDSTANSRTAEIEERPRKRIVYFEF